MHLTPISPGSYTILKEVQESESALLCMILTLYSYFTCTFDSVIGLATGDSEFTFVAALMEPHGLCGREGVLSSGSPSMS